MAKIDRRPVPPTSDAWLAELEAAMNAAHGGGEGMTSLEICRATGMGNHRVMALLRTLNEQGKLAVSRGMRRNVAGYPTQVPLYRLVASKAKKAK